MNLKAYFELPDSMTVAQLRVAARIKSDAQLRQWQHGYAGRFPSPENCVALEQATRKMVRRWDLRPHDWHLIWPELIGAEGAPGVPSSTAEAQRAA